MGVARVHGGGSEQVVKIRAGGQEKPEREEVLEPLEEPTPERRKESVRETSPEREPEREPERIPA